MLTQHHKRNPPPRRLKCPKNQAWVCLNYPWNGTIDLSPLLTNEPEQPLKRQTRQYLDVTRSWDPAYEGVRLLLHCDEFAVVNWNFVSGMIYVWGSTVLLFVKGIC